MRREEIFICHEVEKKERLSSYTNYMFTKFLERHENL